VVAWHDELVNYPYSSQFYPILARRFDSTGLPLSAEFQVNEQTAQSYRYLAIDFRANGAFVVVWSNLASSEEQYRILGRRFDSTGAAQGETFMVSSNTTRSNRRPAIAMEDSGEFLVSRPTTSSAPSSRNASPPRSRPSTSTATAPPARSPMVCS
jgi:hypothetical protein